MRNRSILEDAAWRAYREGRGPKPDSPVSFGRHERKCTICDHPDREAIELEFLRWYSPEDIARDHDLPYASAIYRHAHATGLFDRRRRTIRLALEPLIEQASLVEASAGTIISAIRAYAHLNDAGKWVSPPAEVIHRRDSRSPRNRHTPKRVRGRRAAKSQISNREL